MHEHCNQFVKERGAGSAHGPHLEVLHNLHNLLHYLGYMGGERHQYAHIHFERNLRPLHIYGPCPGRISWQFFKMFQNESSGCAVNCHISNAVIETM